MSASAPAVARLILLGEPLTEVLSNLLSVVINDLFPGRLLPINWSAVCPFFNSFLDFLHDFIAFAVAHVRDSAALIVTNMATDGHEHLVVVDSIRGRFNGNQRIALTLEHENTGLDADERLKRIGV